MSNTGSDTHNTGYTRRIATETKGSFEATEFFASFAGAAGAQ